MKEEAQFVCKIDCHIPAEDGMFCECLYFRKNHHPEEDYAKYIRDTVSNFANFKKDLIQIILEDVPLYAQKRLLEISDLNKKSNWNYSKINDAKTEQYKCQSYIAELGQVMNCTCGKCR